MIYILLGNDTKKKSLFVKGLCKNDPLIFDYKNLPEKGELLDKACGVSLFGEESILIIDSALRDKNFNLEIEDISLLKESKNIIVFLEDKLNATEIKNYKKYAEIQDFNLIESKKFQYNIFSIADSFANRDKIGTWISYRNFVTLGIPVEEISGIIFWKVKDMMIKKSKMFSKEELINISNKLTSIYHRSHRGELDFVIALEELILSSLNKAK